MKKVLLVICIIACILILSLLYIFFKEKYKSVNPVPQSINTNYTYGGKYFTVSQYHDWRAQSVPTSKNSEEAVIISSATTSLPLFKIEVYKETDQKKLRTMLMTRTPPEKNMRAYSFKNLTPELAAVIILYDSAESARYSPAFIDRSIMSKTQ